MKRLQAYKFQLMATPTQERKMARFAGCRRFVYNEALALQKRRFESGESRLGYAALCRELTKWRHLKEKSFLAEAPTHPLQQALKDLERAYGNFFGGRGGLPKFHRRGRQDGFRYPDPKQIKHDEVNGRIFLPKLGWMRYRKSREIAGAIKQVTVSRKCGRWYVSIQTERELIGKERVNDSMVGIDMGVARFATLSDGTVYEPENHYRRNEKRLAKAQRQMSRKRKFGANWRKQLKRVKQLHMRIAECRRDFLHKSTKTICKNHAMVVIEDLCVKGMSASAAGTLERPGTNVRAKAGLNKALLDQGWGEFRRQLEYKQLWQGGIVIAVAPRNTSRMCAKCGHTDAGNRTAQEKFKCVACGEAENADLNAARNILAAGRAVIACGEVPMGASAKQEPTVSAASAA